MTNLPRTGREYFHWTFSGLPDDHGAVEVLISGSWRALEMTGQTGKLLLAGPDVTDPQDAVVVATDQAVSVRVTDSPEIVVRGGGWIRLSDT